MIGDLIRGRKAAFFAGLIAALVAVVVWLHLGVEPPQPHSVHSDEYIQHAHRVMLLQELRAGMWAHPLEWLRLADIDYPPGIYLVAVPLSLVFGPEASHVVWSWMGWVVLLGVAMASVVRGFGGAREARAAAFAAAFLIPAVPGSAARMHYDLPMIAMVWLAVGAALNTWNRESRKEAILGGVLTGVFVVGACLMKWTALPMAGAGLIGAACSGPRMGRVASFRRRVPPMLATLLTVGVGLALFLSISSESLELMSLTFTQGEESRMDGLFGLLPTPLARPLAQLGIQLPLLPTWLTFYLLSLVFMVFSPVLSLLVLGLAIRWLAGERRGVVPLGLFLVLGLGFLTLNVPIADARFVLPLAPIPAVAAVLGWSMLRPGLRRGVGLVTVLVGLAVAVDFHLLDVAEDPQGQIVWRKQLRDHPGEVMHRGLGLASSIKDRGWVRRDEALPHRLPFREALWRTRLACGAEHLGVSPDLITYGDDRYWWAYRASLAGLRGEKTPGVGPPSEICEMQNPDAELAKVLFITAKSGEIPDLPACIADREETWRYDGFVPDPEGGAGAAVFLAVGLPRCVGKTP